MVEPTLKIGKILSSTKLSDRFLDTKIYEPTSPEESQYGNTYLLVEVTSPWFPTARITKIIHSTFLEEYYQASLNRQEIKRFEDGLKAVNKKLSDLAGTGQTEWIGNLNAIIATVCNNRLFLSHTGTSEAYLFRNNKISHITEGEDIPKNPPPIQTFSALINGELEKNDRIVLSNAEMYNFVSIDTIRNAVSQLSPNIAIDEVANILFREKTEKVNAIFIYYSSDGEINTKTATALPDTIFLDKDDLGGSVFKKGFRPKPIINSLKRGIIKVGFATLYLGRLIGSLFSKKTKTATELPAKDELKPESKIEEISYMSRSINVNLSHDRARREKSHLAKGIGSIIDLILNWFKSLHKKWLYGGIALLIILAVAGGIYFKLRSPSGEKIDMAAIVSAAQEKINSAETQAALHNDAEAAALLEEAKAMLESIKDKPKSPVEVVILLDKIQEGLNKIYKISLVDSPKELTNLSSVDANLDTKELVYLNGALYTINTKGRQVMAVIADKGEHRVLVELPENVGEVANLSYFAAERILILLSSNGNLYEYSLGKNKLEEKTNSDEDPFTIANAISTYSTSLYLLNKNESKFIKYSPSAGGYDRGRNVYKEGVINLTDVNSIAIDGNIYLLHQNGAIEKTIRGSLDSSFQVKNMPPPDSNFDNPDQIWTDIDSTSLYILESSKNRVIELNKNGDYLRQFVFKNLSKIKSICVNEKTKKLYLLSNNRLFETNL